MSKLNNIKRERCSKILRMTSAMPQKTKAVHKLGKLEQSVNTVIFVNYKVFLLLMESGSFTRALQ